MSARKRRLAARALVLDAQQRVLLFREDVVGAYWYLPGGAIEPGEDPVATVCRELREETGLVLDSARIVAERRNLAFVHHGEPILQDEWIVLARSEGDVGRPASPHDSEIRAVANHRWWSLAEIRETRDTIFPPQLGELLDLVRGGAPIGRIIRLGS